MTSLSKRALVLGAAALALGGHAFAQGAADWPAAKPVTIVVGFSAGGPTDVVARIVAE